MDSASPRGRSWLAGLLLVLLALCSAALLKAFWSTLTPKPDGATTEGDIDERPKYAEDEALLILADPGASSLERTAATDIVAKQGARALPRLVQLLDHPSLDVRVSAVMLLGRLGPEASDAAPRLRALCLDSDPHLREVGVPAAIRVHRDLEPLRETLFQALALGPDKVSLSALEGLAQLDPPAIEELERLAFTRDSPLKDPAASHLTRIAIRNHELLLRLLKQGFQFPRAGDDLAQRLKVLVDSEEDDALHLVALIQLVETQDPPRGDWYGWQATRYFHEMAEGAKRHRDAPEFGRLIDRLGRAREENRAVVLMGLLESMHHPTRCSAVYWLTYHAEDPATMLPVLRELLKTDVPGTASAVHALSLLGQAGKAAVPELIPLVNSAHSDTAKEARRVLEELGVDPQQAHPVKP